MDSTAIPAAEPAVVDDPPVLLLPPDDGTDWSQAPLPVLVAHIQTGYHRPLEAALPVLVQLAAKVHRVHGGTVPQELRVILDTVLALETELTAHMAKEEQAFFPMILAGHGADGAGLVGMLEEDHADAKRALAELRVLTGGYVPPAGACRTFRRLWHGLGELEAAMHAHIYLEDEVLQPRVVQG
jgi:regulator of cell morphogenesis and NO signaling